MTFHEFPKMLYHATKGLLVVPDAEVQDSRLAEGWVFTQAEADAPVVAPSVKKEDDPVESEPPLSEEEEEAQAKLRLAALRARRK